MYCNESQPIICLGSPKVGDQGRELDGIKLRWKSVENWEINNR